MSNNSLHSTVQRFRTQLASQEANAVQALAGAFGRTMRLIQPVLDRFYEQMAGAQDADGTISLIWLFMGRRLEHLKQAISGHVSHFAQIAQAIVAQAQQVATRLGMTGAQSHLQAAAPDGAAFTAPDLADMAGSSSSPLFDGFGREAAQKAGDALIRGITAGSTPQDIASELQQALSISRTRALTIARDQINSAYRRAILRMYRANSDTVAGWIWHAELSPRTCIACIMMHGTRHPLSEEMHEHVCGRCTPIPFMRVGAASNQPLSGLDWFRQQSATTQKAILGPGKYAAWQRGEFSLNDLVAHDYDPKWGTSIREKSLKELVKVHG